MNIRTMMKVVAAVLTVAVVCMSEQASGVSFHVLGDWPWGDPRAISANGSTVVGRGTSNGPEAFRWTQSGGRGLGDLPGGDFYSNAIGVSADGSVVVGNSHSANGDEAFRWTQGSGIVGLGDIVPRGDRPGGSFSSAAFDVSADGSVVVGYGGYGRMEAFRWTQAGGMVGLGDLTGGDFFSIASGISADGSVVVGEGHSANGMEAFRWTQAGGMVGLGDLTGGDFSSFASDVSANGSVVVGASNSANGYEAFRWTQAGGMVGLGDLTGGDFYSTAYGVSADGSVVVGASNSANGYEAFIWDSLNGMRSLRDLLVEQGLDLTRWTLDGAEGVSADGRLIVGNGQLNNQGSAGWIAEIPEPATLSLLALGGLAVLRRRRRWR